MKSLINQHVLFFLGFIVVALVASASLADARSFIISNTSDITQTYFIVNGTTGYTGIGIGNPLNSLNVIGDINATVGIYGVSIYQNGKKVLDNSTSFGGNISGTYDALNIASDSVDSAKILDGSISAADISNGVITSAKLVADLGLGWANLTGYPNNCAAGEAIQSLGDGSFTCIALNSTSGNISGAGTPNYVSKFITAGILGNSIMFDDGSKIGIGTSSPVKTLDVVGDINATGGLYSANGLVVSGGTVTLPSGEIGNVELANSSLTVTAGNGLTDGGAVSLGSSATLNIGAGVGIIVNPDNVSIDTTLVPRKGVDETITGNWVFQNDLMVGGKISYVNSETLNLNGSIIPPLDDWFTIGNATNRWKNVSAVSLYQGVNQVLDTNTDFSGNVTGKYNALQLASGSVGASQIINGVISSSKLVSDLGLGWGNLTGYPNNCAAGEAIQSLGDGSFTCVALNSTSGNISGSGDQNYVAKFTSSDEVGNSIVYDNGTNVGIGTTAANAKLEVAGGMRLNTTDAKPTCDSAQRGTFWLEQSSGGVDDYMYACMRNSTSGYNWVLVARAG